VLVTVGLLQAMAGLGLVAWGNLPYTMRPFTGRAPLHVGSVAMPTQTLWLAGTLATCAVAVGLLLARTTLGLNLRATAANPEAARLQGVSVSAMRIAVLTMSGALAGLAGVMILPLTFIRFDTTVPFAVNGFVAAVLGGLGRVGGAVAGGLALGILEASFGRVTSGLRAEVLAVACMLVVLLVRSGGLVRGAKARAAEADDARRDARVDAFLDRATRRVPRALRWRPRLPSRLRGPWGWVPALVVIVALPRLVPGWMNFLVVAGVFYLVVLGLDVVTGHAGQVSLGQTVFMAIGGYGAALVSMRAGVPMIASLVVAAAISAAAAFVLGNAYVRLHGYYLALATLGLAVIVQDLALDLVKTTGGPSGLVGVPVIDIGPVHLASQTSTYYALVVLGGAGAAFVRNLTRALRAIAADARAAQMLGIDERATKTRALVVSAVYASVAGTVYASYFRFIAPDMIGVLVAFNVVVILGLGGRRTLAGPLLGALLVQLLPQLGQRVARYEPLLAGLLLVVVISYLPHGLWGGLRSLFAGPVPTRTS
jgi:ABC-type branched-subunit amino acid transport system permease subunit